MKKEIITFEKWYEREPTFATIFSKSPVLNLLYPDVALSWMATITPDPLTPSICVFEEAIHKFSQRYVYIPYLIDADNSGQIHRIQADIMYQSVSEWNRWQALKEVINSQMDFATLQSILGNYSLTKIGGYTDQHNSEPYTTTDTYAREIGRGVTISNFESVNKALTSTSISHLPGEEEPQPALEHAFTPDEDSPAKTTRTYDGGTSEDYDFYREYGQRMGKFWNQYKDLILNFPSSVDLFLKSTAQAYLLDVYDTNMWHNILSD